MNENLKWVRQNIPQLDHSNHAVQMRITFAIANQKRVRNVKRTIKTSDTALLFINWLNHSPSPFSTCSSTVSFCWLTGLYHKLHFLWLLLPVLRNNLRMNAICHFIAKPVLTESWPCCQLSMKYTLRGGQPSTLAIWRTSSYSFTVIPLSACA